jgi:DNA-binding response OmpR family regulator
MGGDVMRVLVVEEDQKAASFLKCGLEEKAYVVDVAKDGVQGYHLAQAVEYNFIILNVVLPKLNGLELCRRLRREGKRNYIVMLTAKNTVADRVCGLDAGGDVCMAKPFAFPELLARLQALWRRHNQQRLSAMLHVSDLVLNLATHQAIRGGQVVGLSIKEFALLEFLMYHPNQILTRAEIVEQVWHHNFCNYSNIVDVFIRYLRRKIDDPYAVKLIHTVRGLGYLIKEP